MGKTFKDRRKFDRKHDRPEGIKEGKKVPKMRRPEIEEDLDDMDRYDIDDYDEEC